MVLVFVSLLTGFVPVSLQHSKIRTEIDDTPPPSISYGGMEYPFQEKIDLSG